MGWYGAVQVDNITYQVIGLRELTILAVQQAQQALEFTATRTSYIVPAGPFDVNVTFLSPVEVCFSTYHSDLTRTDYVSSLWTWSGNHCRLRTCIWTLQLQTTMLMTYKSMLILPVVRLREGCTCIQVDYSDCAEWLNRNVGTSYNWSATNGMTATVLKYQLEDPVPFGEFSSQSLDAVGYHATNIVRSDLSM